MKMIIAIQRTRLMRIPNIKPLKNFLLITIYCHFQYSFIIILFLGFFLYTH